MSVLSQVQDAARKKYQELTEERVTRYKIGLSPRNTFILTIALCIPVILGVVFLSQAHPLTKIEISFKACTESQCSYLFFLDSPIPSSHLYVRVNNLPQKHMAYRPGEEVASTDCTPYLSNGRWIFPCGIVRSTLPRDTVDIKTESGAVVPVLPPQRHWDAPTGSPEEDMYLSWERPSSFGGAIHKIGETERMDGGGYVMTVTKTTNYPETDRDVILISSPGPFGVVLHHLRDWIVAAAVILIVVTGVGAKYLRSPL
ncbi:hypothetical protein NEDG_01508 [Nematocida displodere]|uniref:Uncharacterized protein n=1 Tax=Nematocida displodere TaxID=1805483 RepID=A0A177EEQ6_9MICR|nr:hypothetical protein NEDG_01508 [Nematocida displodere]